MDKSPDKEMTLEFHVPTFPLQQCIASFIYYRDYQAGHNLDRLLPDGNVTLIIDLKEGKQGIYDNDTLIEIQTCRQSWFSGIRSKPITIPSGSGNEMFIVNFHKGKAYPLLQIPLSAVRDQVVDGDQVFGPVMHTLRQQLCESRDITQMFYAAESFFLSRIRNNLEINPFVHYAVEQIMREPHQHTVSALSDKVGFSQKHLIHLFKTHVGLTPKAFMRVMRFQKIIQDIGCRTEVDWTRISYASGYYDQAHFIHDFAQFAGMTPQQYMNSKNEQINYVPVA